MTAATKQEVQEAGQKCLEAIRVLDRALKGEPPPRNEEAAKAFEEMVWGTFNGKVRK